MDFVAPIYVLFCTQWNKKEVRTMTVWYCTIPYRRFDDTNLNKLGRDNKKIEKNCSEKVGACSTEKRFSDSCGYSKRPTYIPLIFVHKKNEPK